MIHSLHLDSFYLSEEQLENSPSRQDGIDKDTEANLRMYGCEIIQEAGIMLAFDQVVMATGQVLLHRFYCKRSMKTFNVKKLAATALWVAAKLEEVRVVREHPRKLLEMVMVAVDRSITRRETPEGRKLAVLDTHSKEGEEFRRALIRYESEMLKAFGFIMNVEHPHRLLCNYCQILFAPYMDKPDKQGFLQTFIQESWNVANDSLRTTLCVRFKGSVVACGIIFYTARRLQVPLPDNWWELFMVKLEHICDVCRILHELYLAPKPSFVPVCHQLLPSKPPTPAVAGGAAVKGAGVTATPTPMLGATPELNTRPGGKPLDPSVRRTLPASDSTPNLAAATAPPANGAAAGSALPSPEGAPAPGSARKRSRSPSPRSPAGDNRKRQQLDSSMQPAAGATELQLQEKAREAIAAAGKAPLSRPRSNAGSDRDGDHRDRGYDRGSRRDRPRSRSRDRSRRSRSRSRDRRRSRSRDRSRRSRSRDRKRSRSRDKGRRSRSRSRDRRRTSRSRSRDRRRERDYKDSRSGSVRDSRDRTDRDRADKGREVPRGPAKPDKQQQQQEPRYPSPPAEPAASASPGKGAGDTAAAAAPAGGGDGSKEQRGGKPNGVGSSNGSEQEPQPGKPTAGGSATADDRAALPPKAKPRGVRKQHPSGAAASPVDSPNAAGDAAPGPQAAGTD